MTKYRDSIVDRNSTTFAYYDYILSIAEDGQSTKNSSTIEDNVKTEYHYRYHYLHKSILIV